jgi:hypothetical protein
MFYESAAIPFVIPSAAEGSAVQRTFPGKCFSTERTRISCHAAPDTTTYAAFIKESRKKLASATKFHRKSGLRSGEICGFFFGA